MGINSGYLRQYLQTTYTFPSPGKSEEEALQAGAVAGIFCGLSIGNSAGQLAGIISGVYYPYQALYSTNPIPQNIIGHCMKLGIRKGAVNGGYAGCLASILTSSLLYRFVKISTPDNRSMGGNEPHKFLISASLANVAAGTLTGILVGGFNGSITGTITSAALTALRRKG